jgi:acetolactate synthase-1/2/3 large subunit
MTLPVTIERTATKSDTRIAAYQMTEYLERLGVEVIFGLCGHTIIALLDALGRSRIRFVSTRHEQIAAHAADGYARASGKPGVVLTHLGPGLTNACTGVANAALDSIPMVVIAGDVPSHYYGRHPHQEVNLHQDADQFQIYRPFCKRVYRVDRADDLPRILERAFHLSQTGRPGPVLIDIPKNIQNKRTQPIYPRGLKLRGYHPLRKADDLAIHEMIGLIEHSKKPLIYCG